MSETTDYTAVSLYDGGWRPEDKDQLMEEYGLTDEEATAICAQLVKIQEQSAPTL